MYSYPNLPRNKDDVTFDVLQTMLDPTTEVVAYDNQEICNKQLRKILSIISEITNDYTPDEPSQYNYYDSDLEKWNAECSKQNEW